MAETLNLPLLLSVCIIFTTLSLTTSRTITTPSHTNVLDVSSSLHQAHQILSFNPQLLEEQSSETETPTSPSSSSSSFSLQLHPRETLLNEQHPNYKTLVLSRLARDTARVNSLNTKLQLALSSLNRSDLYPTETELLRPEDLSTPVSSGTAQGSGEYFSRVGVGQPSKPFYMVLDTGSDVNWLQCKPCSDCYQQSDPIFDPTASSSYNPLTCDAQQCQDLEMSACRNGKCLYQVSYGDGSFTVGEYVTETVSFGAGSVNRVAIGCGHDNEGLFVGSAGLLGLGGGPLSLTSQIKATSFSYCLVDRDSGKSSTLEFNSPRPGDSVVAPLLKNQKVNTFYYVELTGVSVGGEIVTVPPETFAVDQSGAGGVIVDSGTAITRLRTQAYNSVRDAFKRKTSNLRPAEGVALFDTCYDLSSLQSVRVPTVSFHFSGDRAWALPAKNYLIPVDGAGTYCFAFAPTTSSMSIIGNVQQQGTRVGFDIANSLVGFSVDSC